MLYFVQEWEKKKVNQTIELQELMEYLEYFREAAGVIPLQASEGENAVRLMTVHGAKGLEFPHVFILRANSNSFPASYKETLVAFPVNCATRARSPRPTTRRCTHRRNGAFSTLP